MSNKSTVEPIKNFLGDMAAGMTTLAFVVGLPALALHGCARLLPPRTLSAENTPHLGTVHAYQREGADEILLVKSADGRFQGYTQREYSDTENALAVLSGIEPMSTNINITAGSNYDHNGNEVIPGATTNCPGTINQEFLMCTRGMWYPLPDREAAKLVTDLRITILSEDKDLPSRVSASIPENVAWNPDQSSVFINFIDGRWLTKGYTDYYLGSTLNHLGDDFTNGVAVHSEFLREADMYFRSQPSRKPFP